MANEKLIKAELLSIPVEYIKKHIVASDSEFLKGYLAGLDAMIAAAAEIPAADAVQVVHGRWIVDRENLKATCSECGKILRFSDEMQIDLLDIERFCYYCGAKMDGGNEDGC